MPTHDVVVAATGLAALLLLCVGLFLRGRASDKKATAEELVRMVKRAQEEEKNVYRRTDRGDTR